MNQASGRIAATYEAKTGTLTYLSGPAEQAQLFRYNEALRRVGYGTPDVIRIYELADESVGPRLSRTTTRMGRLGNALDIIGLMIGVAADAVTLQRYEESLQWLRTNDPDYYEQLEWIETCRDSLCG